MAEFPQTLTHPDRDDTRLAHSEQDVQRFAFDGYHPEDTVKRIKEGRERIAKAREERRGAVVETATATASAPKRTSRARKSTSGKSTKSQQDSGTPETGESQSAL